MARGTTLQNPHFYTDPSESSPVMAILSPGTSLEVLRREGDFWRVHLNDGREGYVRVELVVPDVHPSTNTNPDGSQIVPVQTGHTIQNPNFHTAPALDSAVIEVLHPGIAVQILGREGDYWRCVLPDGRQGYLHVSLVTVDGSQPGVDDSAGSGVRFKNAAEVDAWFTSQRGSDFITWFNNNHAGLDNWGGARILGAHAAEDFTKLCDRLTLVFDRPSVSLEQFLGLITVVIGETGGRVWPISELVGTAGHSGIAYAFDFIPNLKSSYNVSPNRSAGSLFNDPDFLNAFAGLPLVDSVRNSPDSRWNGTAYPQGEFPTDVDPSTGIILECDFYKFRGRGFIQTTWRSAYKDLIAYVQNTDDPNPVIAKYRAAWAGLTPELVATTSTNAQWDELFQQTDCSLACAGIRIHNKNAGDYLNLSSDRDVLSGAGKGSAWLCGKRVNGGDGYANTLRARVLQLRDSLP